MPKPSTSSITGSFKLGPDGTDYFGYIDIGDDRISCRLVPGKDRGVLNLEYYHIDAPLGTGKAFTIARKK